MREELRFLIDAVKQAGGFVYDKPGEHVLVANSKKNLEILKAKVEE